MRPRRGHSVIRRFRSNGLRIEPALSGGPVELDDYRRSVNELLPVVGNAVAAHRDRVEDMFLATRSEMFTPVPWPEVAEKPSATRMQALA